MTNSFKKFIIHILSHVVGDSFNVLLIAEALAYVYAS